MEIARHFSAGNRASIINRVPEGRLKFPGISAVPPGLWMFFVPIPSTEVLGYFHGIPPGC